MARVSSEAIVLRTRPVGEADLVVTFLTESEGKLSGSAKNARRSRRRFGGGLEPMARGRATWMEVEGKELVRLESFEAGVSFAARQRDLAWFYLFAYVAEVADTFARDREADPRFYRLLRAATDASEAGSPPGTVRRWFEIWTLRLQGLLPALGECSRCGRGLMEAGAVVAAEGGEALCIECSGDAAPGAEAARLSKGEIGWIREALRKPVLKVPEPETSAGIDRLTRLMFLGFTGRPFRTARFLEAR